MNKEELKAQWSILNSALDKIVPETRSMKLIEIRKELIEIEPDWEELLGE